MKFVIEKIHKTSCLRKMLSIAPFYVWDYTVTVRLESGEVLKFVTDISPKSVEFLPEIQHDVFRHLEVEEWRKEQNKKLDSGKTIKDYIGIEFESKEK